jgi:spore maturation protein CgeB
MQTAWLLEKKLRKPISNFWAYGNHLSRVPILNNFLHLFPHVHGVLKEQIQAASPDIVYVQDLNIVPPALAEWIKRSGAKLVGEIASPLPPDSFLLKYDLIVSALTPVVQKLESINVKSEWVPLGFDLDNWHRFKQDSGERKEDVVFVGSISKLQRSTIPLLKSISKTVQNLSVYGPRSTGYALSDSNLGHIYRGQAWGKQMFSILGNAKIVINRHGEIAEGYATNMRMFEATGMGSLLLTDASKNIEKLFIPNEEVICYENPQNAAEAIEFLFSNSLKLQEIARNGQIKTHNEHTYEKRALDLIQIFNKFNLI